MQKIKQYDYESIEICRNCQGEGRLNRLFSRGTCRICGGTGRVRKTTTVIIEINSFVEEKT